MGQNYDAAKLELSCPSKGILDKIGELWAFLQFGRDQCTDQGVKTAGGRACATRRAAGVSNFEALDSR